MQNSWWTDPDQMDPEQKRFVSLNTEGKHLLVGPPGCGKTNLLLLRARYIHGCGLKNVLVITFTRALQDFIKTGVVENKYINPDQIQTFKRWALMHCSTYAPDLMSKYDRAASFEEQRKQIIEMLKVACARVQGRNLYDAIFIDEVQDFYIEEIEGLLKLSDRVTVAGDNKQMIYESGDTLNELEAKGFEKTELIYHYRIGRDIAEVADKAFQPVKGIQKLVANCQYKEHELKSRADLHELESRDAQFDAMCKSIELQIRSYPGEGIAVIVPVRSLAEELRGKFKGTAIESMVAYHTNDDAEDSFQSDKLVHVIPLKSAKGTEFRAVHIYGLEELKYPQVKRELIFMAVTRARTSLDAYYTGKVLASVSSAFAKSETPPQLSDLF